MFCQINVFDKLYLLLKLRNISLNLFFNSILKIFFLQSNAFRNKLNLRLDSLRELFKILILRLVLKNLGPKPKQVWDVDLRGGGDLQCVCFHSFLEFLYPSRKETQEIKSMSSRLDGVLISQSILGIKIIFYNNFYRIAFF